MAEETTKHSYLKLLFFISLITAAFLIKGVAGSRTPLALSYKGKVHQTSSANQEISLQSSGKGRINTNSKRLMIGSVAPTCTYNECRGCKYKCRAEQVPVEGNDPINSAYHYKCVCHR